MARLCLVTTWYTPSEVDSDVGLYVRLMFVLSNFAFVRVLLGVLLVSLVCVRCVYVL